MFICLSFHYYILKVASMVTLIAWSVHILFPNKYPLALKFYTLRICSLKKIENDWFWVNYPSFPIEKAPSCTWVDFHHLMLASLHVYKIWYLKLKLEWCKKRSIFVKWAIQNNSDASAATHLKWKKENNSTWEGAFYQSEWDEINSSWVILH